MLHRLRYHTKRLVLIIGCSVFLGAAAYAFLIFVFVGPIGYFHLLEAPFYLAFALIGSAFGLTAFYFVSSGRSEPIISKFFKKDTHR